MTSILQGSVARPSLAEMGEGPHHPRSMADILPFPRIRQSDIVSFREHYLYANALMGPLPHRRDGALRYVSFKAGCGRG